MIRARSQKIQNHMITRPLNLDSLLRPPPRSFDWAHYVNIGLVAIFFLLFGTRFILSPAIVVESKDFQAPVRAAGKVAYVPGTTVISIKANGQIFTDNGLATHAQLRAWLAEKAAASPESSVLIRADARVTLDEIFRVYELILGAGFKQDRISIPVVPEKTTSPSHPAAAPVQQ